MNIEEVKKFLETDEAGKAYLAKVVEKEREAVDKKNFEVVGRNKKYKEMLDKLNAENSELKDQVETLEDDVKAGSPDTVQAALDKQKLKHDKEISKLTESNDQSKGQISKLLIDNGLNEALIKANISKEHIPAVTALLRSSNDIQISNDSDTPTAIIGDTGLGDFIQEWSQSDAGKLYVSAADNSGGGAKGSGGKASADALADMSPTEKLIEARKQ